MRKVLIVFTLLFTSYFSAQEKGTLKGLLTDKEANNEPLPFANVVLKGTTIGTTTDFDGLYELKVPVGSHIVEFSFLGYKTIEKPITIKAGETITINQVMSAEEGVALDDVVVTTTTSKEKASALLIDQKKAATIETKIGAQELSEKGVSNAESALTKVSGISKVAGTKNVFVRGLGDMYNSTSLNGLPLPSEDPEFKNISLDFFSTEIIQFIDVNKVFSSNIFSDVGGANINIVSKEMTSRELLDFSFGSGINLNVVDADFLFANGANGLGTGISSSSPINNLNKYTFNDGWLPSSKSTTANLNGSFKVGKRFEVGKDKEQTLSLFLTGSFDNDHQFRESLIAAYNNNGDQGTDQTGSESFYSTSQMIFLNTKYKFGEGNTISLNNGFIRKVTTSVSEFLGENSRISDNLEDEDFIRRQQTNKNSLFVNQLLSKFKINKNIDLKVNTSFNIISGSEPDRRTNSFIRRTANNEQFFRVTAGSAGLNHRFYSDLEENDFVAQTLIDYKIKKDSSDEYSEDKGVITAGLDFRNTDRIFNFRQFNFQFNGQEQVDLNNPDALFNQTNLTNGLFEMVTDRGRSDNPNALKPFFYDADRQIVAGFLNARYNFSDNFTVTAGLRFESLNQEVAWDTSLTSSVNNPTIDNGIINESYFLPSLTLKYNFNENSILRFASSLTYIMPQFKQVAPFFYEEINFSSFGNPNLIPSQLFNLDTKYDYFFSSGEVISLGAFYKNISDPINRIQVNSAGNDFSYVNVDKATAYGVEVEFKKQILEIETSETKTSGLMFGLNLSYLNTNASLTDTDRDDLTVRFTNSEDELQGASPFLINTDLTYSLKSDKINLTSAIVANYFADRIYSYGTAGNANFVEESRITLDFVNRININRKWDVSLSAKNLLDPEFEISQSILGNDLAISSYTRGINLSLGVSYKF